MKGWSISSIDSLDVIYTVYFTYDSQSACFVVKCGLLNAKEVYSILVEYWDTIEYTFNILLYVL